MEILTSGILSPKSNLSRKKGKEEIITYFLIDILFFTLYGFLVFIE